MSKDSSQIGVYGLGVMGSNFARNLADKCIKTVVYNRTTEQTKQFIKDHGNDCLVGSTTLKDFVKKIAKPRKIILLVKAGSVTDQVIASLAPLLDKNDTIIDFGNSFYVDTERRVQELKTKGLNYFGCGISGGEKGALKGPSLMPGGTKSVWQSLKPILEAAAASDFKGKPCVAYLGPGGAGHYVKMAHNGIEYGIMQAMSEAYLLLKLQLHMPAPQIGQVFDRYNRSKLNSFLFELAAKVMTQKDDHSKNGYLIDKILDKAAQKGTGAWTSVDGLERGVPIPTIAEAVLARTVSSFKDRRTKLDDSYTNIKSRANLDTDKFIDTLDDALYCAVIVSFAQGMELIAHASSEEKWQINLAEVARIWQGGCIIRAQLLSTIEEELKKHKNAHLLELPGIRRELQGNIKGLRKIVAIAAENEIPTPALASALSYFDGMVMKHGSANFIQALRDAFGSHTYERTDRSGTFHTEWEQVE